MTKSRQLEPSDQGESNIVVRRRRSTGPRTALGKQRSKHNAAKYGIFSNVLLLPWESKEEFDALLSGLRDHYQPVGTLEEVLVDQLVSSLWRLRRNRRRLLRACLLWIPN
jgi:hypothetical protein